MTSRRGFLTAAAATGLAGAASRTTIEPGTNLTKEDLPTPSMILDLDLFEKNVRTMAAHSKATGIEVRPHVKIHKSPEVSKRQLALGAVGVCCATIAECELMNASGIRNVLWTCQPAGKNKISRVAALSKKDPTFMVVVDDPRTVDLLDEAAAAARTKLNVLVDVYVGLVRQGAQPGDTALKIGQKIAQSKNLQLKGLMGYSGTASHTKGYAERKRYTAEALAPLHATAELFGKSGLNTRIVSGGSTGTYNMDKENGLTELQAGSYIFMDTAYRQVGGKNNDAVYEDFEPSLTVMTTVVSQTRDGVASIDAGNKALLRTTDQVKGMPDVEIENQGAEYGLLHYKGDRVKLGGRVEIYPTNLDMSTNVYDRYYVARGEKIVEIWPIMGRAGAAQR